MGRFLERYFKSEILLEEAIKAAPSLICNFFSLIFKKKSFCGPTFLTWVLTYQCQLECRHCLIKSKSTFLTKEEKLKVAENIAKSSTHWVSLSGGEPLIFPEILDIVRILKNNHKKVTITTNGLVLDSFIDDLIDAGLDGLHISMDSHKKDIHDFLRDCPGLFDRVLNTIYKIKSKRERKKPLIKLRCTVSKKNYFDLVSYVDFWKDKADSIHFQPVTDVRMNYVREKNLMFTKEDEGPFRSVIFELQKKYSIYRNSYYSLMPDFIFDRQGLCQRLNYKCLFVASSGLYIVPDGHIAVCYSQQDNTIGNAVWESISSVWKKNDTILARRKIVDMSFESFCSDCFCWCPNTQFNIYLLPLYYSF